MLALAHNAQGAMPYHKRQTSCLFFIYASNALMEHKISPSSNPQLTTPEWVSQHINHTGKDIVHPPVNKGFTHITPPISPNPTRPTEDQCRVSDDFEAGEVDWVVEHLFDVGRVHMICGPAVSGKTRFILQMINDLQNGRPVLGRATSKRKCFLIDGTRDRLSLKVAMRSLGILPSSIPQRSMLETSLPLGTVLSTLIPLESEVIFIDNLAMLIGDGYTKFGDPIASSSHVSRFLGTIKLWCASTLKTVFFTHNLLKHEAGRFIAKDKISGSGMWLANVESALIIDEENPKDASDKFRRVHLVSHNYDLPGGRYEQKSDGRLYEAPKTDEDAITTALTEHSSKRLILLSKMPINETRTVNGLISDTGLARATVFRVIKVLLAEGKIEKTGTHYKRVV